MRLTMGEEIFADPYHISVIRSTLTKSIPARFPDMRDEIVRAFDDCIVLEDGGIPSLRFHASCSHALYRMEGNTRHQYHLDSCLSG